MNTIRALFLIFKEGQVRPHPLSPLVARVKIKLSKTKLHKIGQSGVFVGRLLGPLLKTGLPLMKDLLKPLAKRVLIPLELTAGASATDATIHKKMFRSSTTTSIISNKEMNDIIKIVKPLEESG